MGRSGQHTRKTTRLCCLPRITGIGSRCWRKQRGVDVMGQVATTPQRVARISVCPIPLLPESGYLLIDPGAFSDAGELDFLQPLVCRPTNWSRDTTGLPVVVDLARCGLGQR